jgi:hypothetical protein
MDNPDAGLIADRAGNLYGTTHNGVGPMAASEAGDLKLQPLAVDHRGRGEQRIIPPKASGPADRQSTPRKWHECHRPPGKTMA